MYYDIISIILGLIIINYAFLKSEPNVIKMSKEII